MNLHEREVTGTYEQGKSLTSQIGTEKGENQKIKQENKRSQVVKT